MQRVTSLATLVLAFAVCAGCTEPEIVARTRPDCGAMMIVDGGDAGAPPVDPEPMVPDGGAGCSPYHPPMPPAVSTEGPDTDPTAFAIKQISLDEGGDRWRRIGFDLDTLCSDGTIATADCTPATPPIVVGGAEDGVRGIDNTFGRVLLPALLLAAPALAVEARQDQELGRYDLLLQLTRYNGTDDDPRVDVVMSQTEYVAPSVGVRDGGVPMPADICGARPRWDGTDIAYPGDLAFVGGDPTMPRLHDDHAYVRGGVLVVTVPDRSELDLSGDGRTVRVRLTGATLVGTLSRDRRNLQNVVLSGRWSITDVLEVLPLFGLCPGVPADDSQRAVVMQLLNMGADIRSNPATDRMGLPCDAMSFGLMAQGYRVTVGAVVPSSAMLTPCPMP